MTNRNPARVFGEVADDYDRVRPAYPDALVDDVLNYCGLSQFEAGSRALEVGAGTGRATEAFARTGLPIVAVEPDRAMADVLARRTAPYPGVEIVRRTFEEFRPASRFGLLFSAEAWHWTVPASRWSLASEALAGGGTFALIWNNERIDDPDLRSAMLRVLAEHAPATVVHDDPVTPGTVWTRWPGDELAARPEFGDRTSRHYEVRRAMPKADYLGLTRTRSQFRMLPPENRHDLLAALTALFDDEVPLSIGTAVLLARRTH
jgi:SAM-dependent methyltransferase